LKTKSILSELRYGGNTLTKRQILLLGAIIGVIFFLICFGTASLDVTVDAWIIEGHIERDITCDYASWINYRNSEWGWPLGVNKNMGYPYGNAIAVSGSGSAPVLAIILKAFNSVLPETFQLYGWWMLLCYLLQGMSAALLGSLFTKRAVSLAAISALFTASPILGERAFRHITLCIHYLILFGLYLYIQNSRGNSKGQWWKYVILTSVALTTFPYFYPILVAIIAASLLQTVRRPGGIRRIVGYAISNTTIPFALAWICGLFYSKTSAAREGYGVYSMNLNQPINPVSYKGIIWSRILKERPLVLAQYDGFNYLGFGILAALIVLPIACIVIWRRDVFKKTLPVVRRHWILMLVLLGFTAYAVTNWAFFDEIELWNFRLPAIVGYVTGFFRSSGRIFYGTYYFLFLLVVAVVCRLCRKKEGLACLLLILILAVQLWDVSSGFQWKHDYFSQEHSDATEYDTELMDYVGNNCEKLIFLDKVNYNFHELSVKLAKYGLITNANASPLEEIYGADEYVQQTISQLEYGNAEPNTAYIITNEELFLQLTKSTKGILVPISDANFNMLVPLADDLPDSAATVPDN